MRFSCTIVFKGKVPFIIPTNYRLYLVSMIKEAFNPDGNPSQLYKEFFLNPHKNKVKPYTFSFYIPEIDKKNSTTKKLISYSNVFKFTFSSPDPSFITTLYDGLLKINGKYFPFPEIESYFKNFHLEPRIKLNSGRKIFKTMSPILVRKIENKKGTGFIECTNTHFIESLKYSIANYIAHYINADLKQILDNIELELIDCKPVRVKLYNTEWGTTGKLAITAPAKILEIIYYSGIGAKRSMGFGMLGEI